MRVKIFGGVVAPLKHHVLGKPSLLFTEKLVSQLLGLLKNIADLYIRYDSGLLQVSSQNHVGRRQLKHQIYVLGREGSPPL